MLWSCFQLNFNKHWNPASTLFMSFLVYIICIKHLLRILSLRFVLVSFKKKRSCITCRYLLIVKIWQRDENILRQTNHKTTTANQIFAMSLFPSEKVFVLNVFTRSGVGARSRRHLRNTHKHFRVQMAEGIRWTQTNKYKLREVAMTKNSLRKWCAKIRLEVIRG